jgi:hypothetical protein
MQLHRTDMDLFVAMLNAEIYRANRYGSSMTLMRIELGRASQAAVRFFDRLLSDRMRLIDFGVAVGHREILLCLPHTDAGGGALVARRVALALEDFEPITAVAKFPENGETAFELFSAVGASSEARAALINAE